MGKKIFAIVLVLALSLSLCACGAEPQENVAGAYWYVSGIDYTENDTTIVLNDDFTYDRGYEKGTYKVDHNKIYLHRDNNSNSTTTLVKQGDVYYVESSFEPMKDEYGRTVTFSKDGGIDHTFSWSDYSDKSNVRYYDLVLCGDGTFTFEMLTVKNGDVMNTESNVEGGTYSFENNILIIAGKNFEWYFVCTEEGITREVYKKYTSDEIKEKLLGKWNNVWEVEELPSYEFLEDGTLMRYHESGDTAYTYEIVADGTIKCVGSDGSDAIKFGYYFDNGSFVMNISEPWFMEPWVPFVKE